MNDRWLQIYRTLLLLGDFFAILVAFVSAYVIRVQFDNKPLAEPIYALEYLRVFLLIVPIWLIVFAFLGLYKQDIYTQRAKQLPRLLIGSLIGVMMVIAYQYFSYEPIFPAHAVPAYGVVIAFGLLIVTREIMRGIRSWSFRHTWGVSRVMLIGNAQTTSELAWLMKNSQHTGYHVVAVVGRKSGIPKGMPNVKHFRTIPAALKQLQALNIDCVIQTEWYQEHIVNSRILNTTQSLHINYKFIPSHNEFYTNSNTVELFQGLPAVSVSPTPLIGWGRIIKRAFDTVASILGIILLSPVFVFTILIIKLTDPSGPVFFHQKRVTRHGRLFKFYKFRSLKRKYNGKPAPEAFKIAGREDLIEEYNKYRKIPLEKDIRVTWIGKIMRKTSIDELPQLFNVLRGDISLVGPRAFLPEELELYKTNPLLLSVKTGITGLWQVSGRNNLTFEQRLELELYYVQNWSFWLDIRILFKTIGVVLFRRGIK